MHLEHLALTNFRNYARLELCLPPGVVVFEAGNAQGKTNLLEAIYLLATTKSWRATNERELIHWLALASDLPVARVAGLLQRQRGALQVEIALRAQGARAARAEAGVVVAKHIKVNGLARRALDLLGQVKVVLFGPEDLALVGGPPVLRRRYLDITLSQVDPRYARTLAHYNRVLVQRNHLLRQIQERRSAPDQLFFWDEELAKAGAYLLWQRQQAVAVLNEPARAFHRRLTATPEYLEIFYRSNLDPGAQEDSWPALTQAFRDQLRALRAREIEQGMSLAGPHRDDLVFWLDKVDMNIFGSRGQQRTLALALKLAEAEFVRERAGEPPILLLDEALSELDAQRRKLLLETISPSQQVLITTTDLGPFTPSFLATATLFRIVQGRVNL